MSPALNDRFADFLVKERPNIFGSTSPVSHDLTVVEISSTKLPKSFHVWELVPLKHIREVIVPMGSRRNG